MSVVRGHVHFELKFTVFLRNDNNKFRKLIPLIFLTRRIYWGNVRRKQIIVNFYLNGEKN